MQNAPRQKSYWTFGLAAFFVAASGFTLFVWIPLDIETGVIETFRRRVSIGDAMAPTVMAAAILFVSILMGVMEFWAVKRPLPNSGETKEGLDKQSFSFLLRLFVALAIGLALMAYLGPLVVDLINAMGGEIGSYRQLRATYPYKLIGYVIGGFALVFAIIGIVENRYTVNAAVLSIIAVGILTALYEVPFDNLLLPPNGDN